MQIGSFTFALEYNAGHSKIISVSLGFYVKVSDDAKFADSSHFVFQWYYASLEDICCVFICVKCTGNM